MAAFLLVVITLIKHLLAGRMPILKSPLSFLGLAALSLALFQLTPLPASLASRLSPTAHEAYRRGVLPQLALADDPEFQFPPRPEIRSPVTLDRPATLRWLVGAASCLGIFWAVSHFTDRLARLYLVWGLVVAGFLLNSALAIVQITNRSDGLYGLYVPGGGTTWIPLPNDLLEMPSTMSLRNLPSTALADSTLAPAAPRVVLSPTVPFLFGTMMGSSGAFLAMGTMAMPLALAIVLHLLSPRGSQESLADRLAHSGHGSLVILIVTLSLLGVFLIGLIAGLWFCLPVVVGLITVGLPALLRSGSRWASLSLTALLLAAVGSGTALQVFWPVLLGGQAPVQPPDLQLAQSLWSSSLQVIREFPLVGAGLGSFATIYPYFKDTDISSTTAMSSLLQWGAETGIAGLGILVLGTLWCLFRLPTGLKYVGSIDRSLAHGLIGAAVSISLLAVVHWTVELSAVAISASALGGTCNRWLAGGTDLFVERG
jgi:hypothetical protein